MLDQALLALASAAGAAVAQAAGTDAWQGFRERAARLFGRGTQPDAARDTALERLDRTAAELASPEKGVAEQAKEDAAATWRTRFQDLLEDLDEADRQQAAVQLRALVDQARHARADVSAADEGIAIGGDVHIKPSDGAVGAVKMGNVYMGNPPTPGPEQR